MIIQRFSCDLLDPGIYPAIVRDVRAGIGPQGPRLEWDLGVRTSPVDLKDRRLQAYSSQSFAPQSKLWTWVDAILYDGRGIPADLRELNTDSLVSKSCRIQVSLIEHASGTYNTVDAILPRIGRVVRSGPPVLKVDALPY